MADEINTIDVFRDSIDVYELSTEAVQIIEQGPQGPPGTGGGGGGTVTSVALAGTGLSISGSPVTTSGTITANVSFGSDAGTSTEGNDARIATIGSGTIDTRALGTGDAGTIYMTTVDGIAGSINTSSSAAGYAGGSIFTQGLNAGQGGDIETYDGGGSINTRGTGSIELGETGTRTTLNGSASGSDKTITLPNATGTVALTTMNSGFIAASAPLFDLAQTWNNAAVVFTSLKLNVTNASSLSTSLLADLQLNGISQFNVTRNGSVVVGINTFAVNGAAGVVGLWNGGSFGWSSSGNATATIVLDTILARDAANTLALRNSTNAQTFNLYGQYTSASSYQRLAIKTKVVTLSALSGASVATTGAFIPDGAVLVGLTTRVSTALTGATGYDIGDGSDADRWGANVAIALNTSSDNTNWTAGTIQCFTAAQEVTLTAVGGNFTGGAVVIVAHYLAGEAD